MGPLLDEPVKNGRLLALASADFDAFVTVDKNLPFQQSLATLPIALVVLDSLLRELASLKPRSYTLVKGQPLSGIREDWCCTR